MCLRVWRPAFLAGVFLLLWSPLHAAPIFIDFEGLNEGDLVDSLFGPAVTFSNATILTSGSLLNDLEFPPHSGANVAFNSGSPMRLAFAAPISSFSAFFTYVEPLSLTFFDASSNQLGVVASLFKENFTSSGNPTNELLSGAFAGTAFLTITGAAGSFIVDDVSFETTDVTSVPEPSTILLFGTSVVALAFRKKRRVRSGMPEREFPQVGLPISPGD